MVSKDKIITPKLKSTIVSKKMVGIFDGLSAIIFTIATVWFAFENQWHLVLYNGMLATCLWRLWDRRHWMSIQDWLVLNNEILKIVNGDNPTVEENNG